MEKGFNIAGVQFRRAGKIYDFSCGEVALQVGDHVVVDTERGLSVARVAMIRFEVGDHDLKPIVRKSSKSELEKPSKITLEEVISFTRSKIIQFELNMKILTADIQFGGNKLTIYFSSPGRVDFRELVKTLATGLKARVELKQVGSRDETKLIGGLGICGREYCCSSFLREFVPVSIRMAKNQNLALNPSKVSGGCGRLLCCLTYEDQVYTDLRKILPPRGTKVKLLSYGGTGDVIKSDILNQIVLVETEEGQQVSVAVADIEIVDKAQMKAETSEEWGEDLDLDALSSIMEESGKKVDTRRDGPKDGRSKSYQTSGRPQQEVKESSRRENQGHRSHAQNDRQGRNQSSSPDQARRFDQSRENPRSSGGLENTNKDGSRDSQQTPRSSFEDRSQNLPRNNRQQGDRQQGDRQQGDRQQGDRQQGDRQGQRNQVGRPHSERQHGNRSQNQRHQSNERPEERRPIADDKSQNFTEKGKNSDKKD